jgi:hypothetical protein
MAAIIGGEPRRFRPAVQAFPLARRTARLPAVTHANSEVLTELAGLNVPVAK